MTLLLFVFVRYNYSLLGHKVGGGGGGGGGEHVST